MSEAIFCAIVTVAGYGAVRWLLPHAPLLVILGGSWPVGAVIWGGIGLLGVTLGAPPAFYVTALVLTAALCVGVAWRRGAGRRTSLVLWAGLLAGLSLAVSLAAQWFHATQGSYDTFELVTLGRSLFLLGFRPDLSIKLASWGVFMPMLQGSSTLLHVEWVASTQMLYFASLLVLAAAGVGSAARNVARDLPSASVYAATAGVLLLLSTTYFLVFQSVYIHNSLPSAVYLFLFFLGVMLAREREDKQAVALAFVSLFGFTLCRTEAPLFATLSILTGAYLLAGSTAVTRFRQAAGIYAIVVFAWYGVLIASIDGESDIMTPGRALAQLAVLMLVTVVVFLHERNRLARTIVARAPLALVFGALAVIAVALVWKGGHFLTNAKMVIANMAYAGRWGAAWIVAAALVAFSLAGPKTPLRSALLSFAFAYFILVLALGLFRIPFRVGWGDSANRIFTHLLPLLTAGAAGVLAAMGSSFVPAAQRALSRGMLFGVAALASLCVAFPAGAYIFLPQNVSSGAQVVQARGFCPPSPKGEFGFEQALAARSKDAYAAACGQGERQVVLKLPKASTIRGFELMEYAPGQSWTDFALLGSADNRSWEPLFDTRRPGDAFKLERLSPTHVRITAASGGKVRFLKVDFRAAEGQNRLLLRRFEAYGDRFR